MNIARILLAFIVSILWPATSFAQQVQLPRSVDPLQQDFVIEEITDGSIPPTIVPDERAIAPNGLPDGRVTTGEGDIARAYYTEPTTRYSHGVLGDAIEGGALRVVNQRGEMFTFRPPSTEVFEDIAPRLADLDRNGTTEVITILSSTSEGASVAVFGLNGNALIKIAQTPFIGRANRWLNIAEIENFGGNRRPDIAIVVTPHLAGILQFYRFRNGRLALLDQAAGFSNHFIGSNELRLSAVADFNNNGIPDLLIPSLDRNQLVVVGVRQTSFAELARVTLPARINRPITTRENDGRAEIIVGLDDGKIYAIRQGGLQ